MTDAWLAGVGLWSPAHPDVASWRAQEPREGRPDDSLLNAAQRRRATLLARMASDALLEACAPAAVPPAGVALVLGTVGGELAATFDNLELLVEDPPSASPMRFRNTVHSAPLGYMGISTGHTGFASAVCAPDEQVVAMTWLEGWSHLAVHGEAVAVMLADERWPGTTTPELAVAFLLVLAPIPGVLGKVGPPRRGVGRLSPRRGAPVADNPVGVGLQVIDSLLDGPGDVALTRGGSPWCVAWTPA